MVVASPSGATRSWDELVDGLAAARVVAVGEKHDEASHHLVQAKVLAALAERDPKLIVGLEMVSQDQQAALDDFRSGKTSENDFASWWKKNWGFDYSLYKLRFRRGRAAKNLRIAGLNAPIALVKAVARKRAWRASPQRSAPPSPRRSGTAPIRAIKPS